MIVPPNVRGYTFAPMSTTSISIAPSRRAVVSASLPTKLAAAAACAALLGLAAQVKFPVPGTTVPGTLQTLVVVLIGATLGGRWGAAAVAAYLVGGLAWNPLFAVNGAAFVPYTGGYLIGFLVAQPLIGWLTHVPEERPGDLVIRMFLAGVVAHIIIFGCGMIGLVVSLHSESFESAFNWGVLPFLVGTGAKIVVAMLAGLPLLALVRPRFEGR